MQFDVEKLKAGYLKLSSVERAKALADFAQLASIGARDNYEVEKKGLEKPEEMRVFNEVLIKVLTQINHELFQDSRGYPDDVFLDILIESVNEYPNLSYPVGEMLNSYKEY